MRTRLPVKLKVAVLSAALTFAILCLFAVVVGTVAEQRIVGGFDDELRANVGELQDRITLQQAADGSIQLRDSDTPRCGLRRRRRDRARGEPAPGPVWASDPGVRLGPPIDRRGHRHRRPSRDVPRACGARAQPRPASPFDLPRPVAQPVGYVQYAKPEAQRPDHREPRPAIPGARRAGRHAAGVPRRPLVAKRAMRPIAGLTRAAREVARTRDPDITLPKSHANDEVSDLAHTFEDMLGELSAARGETEATLARQRKFVADASHELRTPLTSILANLELLESELAGEQRDMADSALRSSRRMRRLVGDLLLLARADAGRELPRGPVDLAAVAAEAAREAAALSAEPPALARPARPVMVNGVADDLHRLAGNLIENALIHTPPGTPVTVSVRRDGRRRRARGGRPRPGVPQRCASGCSSASPAATATRRPGAAAASASRSCGRSPTPRGHVELSDARGRRRALRYHPLPAADATRSDYAATVFGPAKADPRNLPGVVPVKSSCAGARRLHSLSPGRPVRVARRRLLRRRDRLHRQP